MYSLHAQVARDKQLHRVSRCHVLVECVIFPFFLLFQRTPYINLVSSQTLWINEVCVDSLRMYHSDTGAPGPAPVHQATMPSMRSHHLQAHETTGGTCRRTIGQGANQPTHPPTRGSDHRDDRRLLLEQLSRQFFLHNVDTHTDADYSQSHAHSQTHSHVHPNTHTHTHTHTRTHTRALSFVSSLSTQRQRRLPCSRCRSCCRCGACWPDCATIWECKYTRRYIFFFI